MKWNITRKRMAWAIAILLAVLAILATTGCTKREEAAAKKTGGAVGGLFGLPPMVGEGLVGLAFSVATAIAGHKNGRKKERKCAAQKATA